MSDERIIEALREAESMIGTPTTEMFIDRLPHNPRLLWLTKVRRLLLAHGVEPENLSGCWQTPADKLRADSPLQP